MLNDTLVLHFISSLWGVAPSVPRVGLYITLLLGDFVRSHQGDKTADEMNEQLQSSSVANSFPPASGEEEV